MKPFKFLILLIFISLTQVYAAFLKDIPQILFQPNGDVLHVFATGDEFSNWLHDENGFVIIRDSHSGYYVYAEQVNSIVAPSEHIVGRSDPAQLGLEPFTPLTQDEYTEARKTFGPNSGADPGNIVNAPTTGTLNNIVIFIRFNDDTEFTDQISVYDQMFNSSTSGDNSLYNFFKEASYNQLDVLSTNYPTTTGSTVISYQDSYNRNYYEPYDAIQNPTGYDGSTERRVREHALLQNAVNAVSSQIPANLNVDGDNDDYVDNVVFIVYGDANGWSNLLWPHKWALYTYDVRINGKRVWEYNFQLQIHLGGSGVGVLCHEMFHSLGAPDLYVYPSEQPTDYWLPVGPWDLMAYTPNPPVHMGAYMKYQYGNWITSIPEITTSGTYALNPLTDVSDNCYKIQSPNTPSEYFVLEYRNEWMDVFEGSLPGSGLLVYRINEGQENKTGPLFEVYIYRPDGTLNARGDILYGKF